MQPRLGVREREFYMIKHMRPSPELAKTRQREFYTIKHMRPSPRQAKVPDLNGFAEYVTRVCNEFLPMFPRGQRRFTCRPHLWERIGKKSRKARLLKPRKRLLASIWTRCYKDARMLGLSLVLKQADIDRILDTIDIGYS